MVYPDELVTRRGDMKVGLFLVDEKRVRHPDVLDELGAHAEGLDSWPFPERQSGVRPELPEVEVEGEVLREAGKGQKQILDILIRENWERKRHFHLENPILSKKYLSSWLLALLYKKIIYDKIQEIFFIISLYC